MQSMKFEVKMSLKSDEKLKTELNSTANHIVNTIDKVCLIISNTFEPKIFFNIGHKENHKAYSYIYSLEAFSSKPEIVSEENFIFIEKLLECIKVITEKPKLEEFCSDWIAKLRSTLITSDFCEDEEGIEEISDLLDKLRRRMSRIASKLKIELCLDYHSKKGVTNNSHGNNRELFKNPHSNDETGGEKHPTEMTPRPEKTPEDGNDNTDTGNNSTDQSETIIKEDSITVDLITELSKGQLVVVPKIQDSRANFAYTPHQMEYLRDVLNKHPLTVTCYINVVQNLDGTNTVLRVIDNVRET